MTTSRRCSSGKASCRRPSIESCDFGRRIQRRVDRDQPRSGISASDRDRARDHALDFSTRFLKREPVSTSLENAFNYSAAPAVAAAGWRPAASATGGGGGFGLGLAAAPGAGLTSIGGGSGATCCWLVTGAGFGAGAGAVATGGGGRARCGGLWLRCRRPARIAAGDRHWRQRLARRGHLRRQRLPAPPAAAISARAAAAAAHRARSHPAFWFRDRSSAPPARTTAPSRRRCG